MNHDRAAFNLFTVAMERMSGAIKALGARGTGDPNFDIVVDVGSYDLAMPDILCDRIQSYSQHGEDVILAGLLRAMGIEAGEKPVILELGSNHPVNMSNTWLLYKQGYRSVLVEANPRYERDTVKARPEDTFLCAGVTPGNEREAILFVPQHAEVASFSLPFVSSWYERRGWKAEIIEVKVPLHNINQIFETYFDRLGPAILTLDLEGLDFQIIQSIDWERWKPRIICLERDRRARSSAVAKRYLEEKGYELIAATDVNDIFKARD